MKEPKKWTKANRIETIVATSVDEWPEGHPSRPLAKTLRESGDNNNTEILEAIEDGRSLWVVLVETKFGLKSDQHFLMHATKAAAIAKQNSLTIGNEYLWAPELSAGLGCFAVGSLSFQTLVAAKGFRGEAPYFLIYETLHECGVYRNHQMAPKVAAWIGKDGEDWLRTEFGENWEAVAVMEYCVHHFPETSMAVYAARVLVSEFVASNDFDAGFASAELMAFDTRAEELAIAASDAQSKRNNGSGRQSAKAKLERVEAFLNEIEKLADVAGRVSERAVLDQAWRNLESWRNDTPSTQSVRQDYETIVRCDLPFKNRYEAVFPKNA